MQAELLRNHIDALLRLSHDVEERAISARLREMADECRIMLSVADITDQVENLNKACRKPPAVESRLRLMGMSDVGC
jgi:hypothetical protein